MRSFIKSFIVFSLLIAGLTNCTSLSPKEQKLEESNLGNLPAWVLDPSMEGMIAAVGIAPKSRGGIQFQIPKAEADARANIAAQINTEVSRLTKSALRESKINDVNDIEDVFTQATKNVVKKINLLGARRVNIFKDPEDGTLFVHMALDSEMVANFFELNKDLYKNQIANSKLARENIDQAEQAVDHLFKELNSELK
jgi:hypothetical protein